MWINFHGVGKDSASIIARNISTFSFRIKSCHSLSLTEEDIDNLSTIWSSYSSDRNPLRNTFCSYSSSSF